MTVVMYIHRAPCYADGMRTYLKVTTYAGPSPIKDQLIFFNTHDPYDVARVRGDVARITRHLQRGTFRVSVWAEHGNPLPELPAVWGGA